MDDIALTHHQPSWMAPNGYHALTQDKIDKDALLTRISSNPEANFSHLATSTSRVRNSLFKRPRPAPVSTRELLFMRGKPKPPEQPNALWSSTFSRASLNETALARNYIAWRIIREMAYTKRQLVDRDDLLQEVIPPANRLGWELPAEDPQYPYTTEYVDNLPPHTNTILHNILTASLRLKEQYWPQIRINNNDAVSDLPDDIFEIPKPDAEVHKRAGLPLLPPPVPQAHMDAHGDILPTYDPEKDYNLVMYVRAISATAEFLGIYQEDGGPEALAGITNPYTVRLAMPSPCQLVSMEYVMVEATLQSINKTGVLSTKKMLQHKYNLSQIESVGLINLSRRYSGMLMLADKEHMRAQAILQCQQLNNKAQDSLNLDLQFKVAKQLGLILGLTREDPDEGLKEFANVIKGYTMKREMSQATLPQPPENYDTDDEE